jgi:hypothetical protein
MLMYCRQNAGQNHNIKGNLQILRKCGEVHIPGNNSNKP